MSIKWTGKHLAINTGVILKGGNLQIVATNSVNKWAHKESFDCRYELNLNYHKDCAFVLARRLRASSEEWGEYCGHNDYGINNIEYKGYVFLYKKMSLRGFYD